MEEKYNSPHVRSRASDTGERKKKGSKKKKHSLPFLIFKKLIVVIATTLLSLFMVIIITGTIVSTALTVYVLNFMDESTNITLQELESGSDTYFYGTQKNDKGEDELVVLHKVKTDVQRIPVTIDRIPQHVRNAFVYTEDERFYTHDGVDYKRTFSAFVNMFVHIYDTEQGGSTITQQLIKNLTGDDEHTPQRKIREIFSAMQLEKSYTKDEILVEYLNYIGFGGPVNGIQLASIRYFGKNVEELTVPEAAVLAAIPKSPEHYGPFVEYTDDETGKVIVDGRANNRSRQEYVLFKLYENGAITYDEYQKYLNAKLIYTDSQEYINNHPEKLAEELEEEQKSNSWVVDAIYYEVARYFEEQFNIDEQTAINRINQGGYKIYSCVDDKMQKYVEERFLDASNLISLDATRRWFDLDGDGKTEEVYPHVAFVAMNYNGEVMAAVGDTGEKVGSLGTNYAVYDPRQVGSTMKPVGAYAYALENDLIHWGSIFQDKPIMTLGNGKPWPTNYGNTLSYGYNYVYYFLQQSYNTVPAQIIDDAGVHNVYKFCKEQLGLRLDPGDEDVAPLALGALTYGITLENLVNGYLPYGNKGVYNEAHIVTRIEDSNQEIIYQNNGNPRQAVSDETAWVMNRLLKNVVQNGTGTAAQLGNKVVVGKTGTTDNWYDEAFVGLTRDFVSGITVGYKRNDPALSLPTNFKSAQVWKNVIGDYANTEFLDTPADFDPVDSVVEGYMCPDTGCIAGAYCGKSVYGYWKSSNAPYCNGTRVVGIGSASVATNAPVNNNYNNNSYNNNGYNNGGNTWSNGDSTGGGNDWSSGGSTGGDTSGDITGGDTGGGNITGGGDVGGGDVGGGDVGGGDAGGGDVGGGDVGGGDAGGGAATE